MCEENSPEYYPITTLSLPYKCPITTLIIVLLYPIGPLLGHLTPYFHSNVRNCEQIREIIEKKLDKVYIV
jgi:hypothetical protein